MKTLEELMALAANCEDAAHELRQAERADASADVIVALRSALWSDRERLRSALAEVVEDAKRLDWLERNLFDGKWGGTIGESKSWHMAGPYRHALQQMRGETLRTAIDSARSAA